MSDTPPNAPKALPAPPRKPLGFWHGFVLHALVTVSLLIIFWALIPRLFPVLSTIQNQWVVFEKKIQELEHSLLNIHPSSPPDLSRLESALAQLEQKMKDLPSATPTPLNHGEHSLLHMGYLLRLDQAFTMGQGYEYLLTQLSTPFKIDSENYPQLIAHQKIGFETIPAIIEKLKETTSSHGLMEAVPLPDHIWTRPLEKFIKVRKQTTEKNQNSPIHQILILVAQNKLDEALDNIKTTGIHEDTPGVKDIRNLIEGRKELEKLWKAWESSMTFPATEEKIP